MTFEGREWYDTKGFSSGDFVLGCSVCVQRQHSKGPVIDAHAHIRFDDSDGLLKDQPIGAAPIMKLDETSDLGRTRVPFES